MKLKEDFGVRALLATIALSMYELIIIVILALLHINKILTFDVGLAIAGLSQAPAMLAVGFYFGSRSSPQSAPPETLGDSCKDKAP